MRTARNAGGAQADRDKSNVTQPTARTQQVRFGAYINNCPGQVRTINAHNPCPRPRSQAVHGSGKSAGAAEPGDQTKGRRRPELSQPRSPWTDSPPRSWPNSRTNGRSSTAATSPPLRSLHGRTLHHSANPARTTDHPHNRNRNSCDWADARSPPRRFRRGLLFSIRGGLGRRSSYSSALPRSASASHGRRSRARVRCLQDSYAPVDRPARCQPQGHIGRPERTAAVVDGLGTCRAGVDAQKQPSGFIGRLQRRIATTADGNDEISAFSRTVHRKG